MQAPAILIEKRIRGRVQGIEKIIKKTKVKRAKIGGCP